MKNVGNDRRTRKRIQGDRKVVISCAGVDGLQAHTASVQDISDDGLSFKLHSGADLPQNIKIEIQSSTTAEKIRIPSSITWRRPADHVYGVTFRNLTAIQIAALRSNFGALGSTFAEINRDRRQTDRRSDVKKITHEVEAQNLVLSRLRKELRCRVAVTGLGVISPIGLDAVSLWKHVAEGHSAIDAISLSDGIDGERHALVAAIKTFDPSNYLDGKKARRLHRHSQLACSAALLAMEDAKLKVRGAALRCGVFEGTSIGGIENIFKEHRVYLSEGASKVNPLILLSGSLGDAASEISMLLRLEGPSHTICTGSASSTDAIGMGFRALQRGDLDVVVVGGAEAPILPEIVQTFQKMGVLTQDVSSPKTSMKPFDKKRDGFALGEGAAFLVLEKMDHAIRRNARIYAELVAYGNSCDAYHPSASDPLGRGLATAVHNALSDAGLKNSEIDYVNMHGTATSTGDHSETQAMKMAFGSHADKMYFTSTKPMTGHLLGASGALETLISILSLQHGMVPPTLNLQNPEFDLNFVPHHPKSVSMNYALNVNCGFGGKNAALILKSVSSGKF